MFHCIVACPTKKKCINFYLPHYDVIWSGSHLWWWAYIVMKAEWNREQRAYNRQSKCWAAAGCWLLLLLVHHHTHVPPMMMEEENTKNDLWLECAARMLRRLWRWRQRWWWWLQPKAMVQLYAMSKLSLSGKVNKLKLNEWLGGSGSVAYGVILRDIPYIRRNQWIDFCRCIDLEVCMAWI